MKIVSRYSESSTTSSRFTMPDKDFWLRFPLYVNSVGMKRTSVFSVDLDNLIGLANVVFVCF